MENGKTVRYSWRERVYILDLNGGKYGGITGKRILSRIHNVYDPSDGGPPPRRFSPPIDRNYARSTVSNDRTVKAKNAVRIFRCV